MYSADQKASLFIATGLTFIKNCPSLSTLPAFSSISLVVNNRKLANSNLAAIMPLCNNSKGVANCLRTNILRLALEARV